MISLGIDTSNYTTSAAIYDGQTGICQKQLIAVKNGQKGMRQSNVLFEHIKNIGNILDKLFKTERKSPTSVGVSARPTENKDSYMPCFLAGVSVAQSISAALHSKIFYCTHRQNHIASALYSSKKLNWLKDKEFIAFHLSGGTTDWVYVKTKDYQFKKVEKIGGSLDLNAGQLIDRVGVYMGLSFPSGPEIDKLAADYTAKSNEEAFKISVAGENCNLSGIENLAKTFFEKGKNKQKTAYYTLTAVKDTVNEIIKNIKQHYNLPILFMGGVSGSLILKEYFKNKYGAFFAEPDLSSDNALGAAILSYFNSNLNYR